MQSVTVGHSSIYVLDVQIVFASYYFRDVETTYENCSTSGSLSVAGLNLGDRIMGAWGYYIPGVPTGLLMDAFGILHMV